jgi:hypothetical protein
MSNSGEAPTGIATRSDALSIARLLHDFNEEFGEATPTLSC